MEGVALQLDGWAAHNRCELAFYRPEGAAAGGGVTFTELLAGAGEGGEKTYGRTRWDSQGESEGRG